MAPVRLTTQAPQAVDPYWTYNRASDNESRRYTGWLYTDPYRVTQEAHLRCDTGTDALLHMAQALDELGLGLALTSYVPLPEGEAVSAARLLFRLWSAGGDFSAVHHDAMRAARYLDPDATDFIKRYLTVVLRQWELAGNPVPQEWVERAHSLIDAHAAPDTFASLLDELLHPPA